MNPVELQTTLNSLKYKTNTGSVNIVKNLKLIYKHLLMMHIYNAKRIIYLYVLLGILNAVGINLKWIKYLLINQVIIVSNVTMKLMN